MTASAIQPKRERGRPTKYKPEFVERVRDLALLGLNHEQMAAKIGVSYRTFETFCRNKPDFSHAVNSGGENADGRVVRSLYERACGYSHDAVKIFMPQGAEEPVYASYTEHYPPDTAAAFIWLKNRRRLEWRDRHEVEHKHAFEDLPQDQRQGQLWTMAERAGLVIDHEPSGFDGVPEEECEDE